MRLMSAVLGFVLRKAGLLGALMLSLFLVSLLIQVFIPTLREAVAERDRLQQVAGERAALEEDLEQLRGTFAEEQRRTIASLRSKIDAEVEEGRRNISATKAQVANRRENRDDVCGVVKKVIGVLLPGNACKSAEEALAKANEALITFERNRLFTIEGVVGV